MLTGRTYTVLIAAVILYFFANQTQVGWLYVMSALIGGLVPAAALLSRGMLRDIDGSRRLGDGELPELYEGDDIDISLTLRKTGRGGGAQIRLTEHCPLAAPESPWRETRLFIPSLPAGDAIHFDYTITLDRRGVYEFPDLTLETHAPFGFFRRERTLAIPTRALVYPEVLPLHRLALFDRQFMPQVARQTAGLGYEVIGLRPYRPGDSPRHIHWRTVARTGQLVSKEFADETQPGLLLALDLFTHPYPNTASKHTPFEWAVKAAASIGDYAGRKQYPLTLATNAVDLPAPRGAVGMSALLQYLARVQPIGDEPLTAALRDSAAQSFVAVILPWPDEAITSTLIDLQRRNAQVLAILIDPASFSDGGPSARGMAGALHAAGIDTRLIRFGDNLVAQLNERQEIAPAVTP
ncbi:MAG: DUF58 domain-containing protein [Chloroflexi bacterium]|nr:DUF58 domain-containing protein [Chloroflexota bacterium]